MTWNLCAKQEIGSGNFRFKPKGQESWDLVLITLPTFNMVHLKMAPEIGIGDFHRTWRFPLFLFVQDLGSIPDLKMFGRTQQTRQKTNFSFQSRHISGAWRSNLDVTLWSRYIRFIFWNERNNVWSSEKLEKNNHKSWGYFFLVCLVCVWIKVTFWRFRDPIRQILAKSWSQDSTASFKLLCSKQSGWKDMLRP